MEVESNYKSTERDQDVIGMMKLVKGVMLKFYEQKEPNHTMWEAYVSVLWCRQQKFDTNQDFFEQFKDAKWVIIQYDGSIVQVMDLINNLGSKEDEQEKLLAVRLVQKYNEVRYADIKSAT